nr:3,4-dihydroxy-2-butanone-4-phosphate synthase [Luteimonas sp.]
QSNTSQHHTNFTVSIEAAEGVTTGISAYDRAHTIRTAVRPDARPDDLSQPGHIFPLMAQPGGVLARSGHTEAAADLALLAGLEPAGVLVEILNPDGSMARRPELEAFAREHGLKIGSIEDLIRHRLDTEHTVERVDDRAIDTPWGGFRLVSYRDRLDHALHFALVRGTPDAARAALVRVQPLNPLSDALHWRRGDFGPATGEVLARLAEAGDGALVLLDEPHDPEALLARIRDPQAPSPKAGRAGMVGQWRRNGAGAQILHDLGFGRLRVLGTPRRQVGLAGFGLEIVEYVVPGCDGVADASRR